jgi:hypothetical protein
MFEFGQYSTVQVINCMSFYLFRTTKMFYYRAMHALVRVFISSLISL